MNGNNLASLTVSIIVGIIIVGCVLMPVINDATQSTEKIERDQANIMNLMNETSEFTLTFDHSTRAITLNDVALENLTDHEILVVTDKVCVEKATINNGASLTIWADGLESLTISGVNKDTSISLSSGTLTFTNGDDTETYTTTFAYIYDKSGDYAAIKDNYTNAVKVNDGDKVVLFDNGGWYAKSYVPVVITATSGEVSGTITEYAANGTTGTAVDLTVTFKAGSFDNLTITNTQPTLQAIAPATYTDYENNISNYGTLLGIIPILVIIGLVLAGATAIITRKD